MVLPKKLDSQLGLVNQTFGPKDFVRAIDLPKELSSHFPWLNKLIGQCSSFLKVREETVYFYLSVSKGSGKGLNIFLNQPKEDYMPTF